VEAKARKSPLHGSWAALSRGLSKRSSACIPASSIYALAAIETGCAFIDFTPSTGLRLPALRERAATLGAYYGGSDGKTGETLVKSALAPMFAMRNLNVLSWTGHNLLGNRDGRVLRDPRAKASKIVGKDAVVRSIVGGSPETHVAIDYVRSLDDWKVAWDYVHFSGFLGTRMAMQFTWQGCDSMLAAPLVIDLARFAALEMTRGCAGPMKHLACFFKDPIGVRDHELSSQFGRLVAHVSGTGSS
jgi:myo-inositol-1-phosphate synthase